MNYLFPIFGLFEIKIRQFKRCTTLLAIIHIIFLQSYTSLVEYYNTLIWGFQLIGAVTIIDNHYLLMAVLIVLLSFLFLNRKLLIIFIPLFFISLFIMPVAEISYIEIVLSLFVGVFSHIVLDSFTPAGIKIFAPLSSRKVYRNFGLSIVFLMIVSAVVIHIPILFKLFEQYLL